MRKGKGFTLVEIMIVVAIIGLLAAIAIPSFVKARQTAQINQEKQKIAFSSKAELLHEVSGRWYAYKDGTTQEAFIRFVAAAQKLKEVDPYDDSGIQLNAILVNASTLNPSSEDGAKINRILGRIEVQQNPSLDRIQKLADSLKQNVELLQQELENFKGNLGEQQ